MLIQNPEQIARDKIDKQLLGCGRIVQDIKKVNLHAGTGVAVSELLSMDSITKFMNQVHINRHWR